MLYWYKRYKIYCESVTVVFVFNDTATTENYTGQIVGSVRCEEETGPGSYSVVSEWESRESFLAWEEEPGHRGVTKPLQAFWRGAGTRRNLFDVAVSTD